MCAECVQIGEGRVPGTNLEAQQHLSDRAPVRGSHRSEHGVAEQCVFEAGTFCVTACVFR